MGSNPIAGIMAPPAAASGGSDPSANSPMLAGLAQPAATKPQPSPPAPTHDMTVSALTHLHEIELHMRKLMADKKLGKEDMRDEIAKSAKDLLDRGFLTLPQVMNEIQAIPEDPVAQRKWVTKQLTQNQMAQRIFLEDHAQGHPQTGDFDPSILDRDHGIEHVDMMKSLVDHYKSRKGGM